MKPSTSLQLIATLIIGLYITQSLNAQGLNHVQGDIMVSMDLNRTPYHLEHQVNRLQSIQTDVEFDFRQVSSIPLNVWILEFDHNTVNEIHLLQILKSLPEIHHAQFNHIVKKRNTPNDPLLDEQWQYINFGGNTGNAGADLDMDLAWDITTGGLTAHGDTIVVAVIDDGIDIDHEDLRENLWKNYEEVPNNGVDDDNNGYVDDYLGWNSIQGNDNIDNNDHGTSVSGIIGAKGNNGIGVSGVNWDVKLMTVRGIGPEDVVIAAYSYVWTQRKRYNDTDGAEGAFVVAANSSFGLDVTAEEAPLWCDFYDQMGNEGIISAGATSNSNKNVDTGADMPSNCTSDYLIMVTNMLWDDVKKNGAGFGAMNVDLGAYGERVFTTNNTNTYNNNFGGTSAATPHVTGVAALLYSMDCDALITEAKSNPAGAALAVKNYILSGVVPNESLEGITLTEGKLNAANTLQLGINACSNCPPPIAFTVENIMPFSIAIEWTDVDNATSYDIRYRELGSSQWTVIPNVPSSYLLQDLTSCNFYEVELKSNCANVNSDFGLTQNILTSGCCVLPDLITSESEGDNVFFSWTEDEFTSMYSFQYRLLGSEEWITETISDNNFAITEVTPCISYEARLTSICGDFNSESEVSDIIIFTTECGTCTGSGYCSLESVLNNGSEWIESVILGDLISNSGKDNNGYGNYLGGPSTELLRGSLAPLVLTPGFSSTTYNEFFTVWIDWNNDEMFDENTELIFESIEGSDAPIAGTFFVPESTNLGSTRLRIIMNFDSKQGPCDPNNDDFRFGEVEDYCVEITGTNSTNNLLNDFEISLLGNPVGKSINFDIISESSMALRANLYSTDGQLIISQNWDTSSGMSMQTIDASQLTAGLYLVNITDGSRSINYKVIKL